MKTTPPRPIGIIGAMEAEMREYLSHSRILETRPWGDFLFHSVELEGRNAVLVQSGIGKVFAAMICQKLIDEFAPSAILFTGVAGALNPALEIGDVVVSRDCLQHDVDGAALGFSRGTLLYTERRIFTADKNMAELALQADLGRHRILLGRILTGDQFLTREEIDRHTYLAEELEGDVVEMEGGAIAQVCTMNRLPFLIVRTVSDRADGKAVKDFQKFLPIVASNSFQVVKSLLRRLNSL